MMLWILVLPLIGLFVIETIFYIFYVPRPQPVQPRRWDTMLGALFYGAAYAVSLLRLPFAFLPYLLKVFLILVTRDRLNWSGYGFQALRLAGDFANLLLTISLIETFTAQPVFLFALYLAAGAEAVRLLSEKGQMLFSAAWQSLPHRRIALRLHRVPCFSRYCAYYALDDAARLAYLVRALRVLPIEDSDAAARLAYFSGFCAVPRDHSLRCGAVRSVAAGEVYIHPGWSNDPWLLVGQALRRAPWVFDPRYLPRPFYYRSQSNRVVTRFVLNHARYSLPYAWYQFGHECKVARYDAFFRLMRYLGWEFEMPVPEDGVYRFDPLLNRLALRRSAPVLRPLWTDAEVIADLARQRPLPSAEAIAARYTYPLKYVEDVLLAQVCAASQSKACRTAPTT